MKLFFRRRSGRTSNTTKAAETRQADAGASGVLSSVTADFARPFDALVANDHASALAWYEKRRDNLVKYPHHLYDWARLLCNLGRRSEAEPLFDHLANLEQYAMFVAGQRLIGCLDRGLTPEEALECAPLAGASVHREAIATAMAEFDLRQRPPSVRHIAICGVSFCGSTLLDLLMEGLPDVASIGESVWLTLSYVGGKSVTRNYSQGHGPGIQECNYCGGRCEFLTANFRNSLALNPIDWYLRIAARLGTRILVSADKNLEKIVPFDPLLRLQALVVFKSPKQAWASTYTKMTQGLTSEAYFDAMIEYMRVWKEVYTSMLNTFRPRDGKFFFEFEAFARAPKARFEALARALDLEYEPHALFRPSPGHSLGGNDNALRGVRDSDYRVEVRPLGDPAIPADHAAWIDDQTDLTELHAAMRRLSEDLMARAT